MVFLLFYAEYKYKISYCYTPRCPGVEVHQQEKKRFLLPTKLFLAFIEQIIFSLVHGFPEFPRMSHTHCSNWVEETASPATSSALNVCGPGVRGEASP